MKLYRYKKRNTPPYLPEIVPDYEPIFKNGCVLAVGFFDGVHLGHRALIKSAKVCAYEMGLPFGILTFPTEDPLKTDAARLGTTEDKCSEFLSLGADFTVLCDFDAVSDMSPEDFVTRVLIDALGCRLASVGYNFRFGKKASGDASLLKSTMQSAGADAIILNEYKIEDKTVSASDIRSSLTEGRPREAWRLLGVPCSVRATVGHGIKLGRSLGFPTVNTPFKSGLLVPKHGVYRTAIRISDELYTALTNVGTCPTFGQREAHAETFILGFDGDAYGKDVRIFFLDYLREEIAFEDANSLKMQINVDINRIKNEFGEVTWQEIGLS